MNPKSFLPTKTEPLDHWLEMRSNHSAFADLSNRRVNECYEYNADYESSFCRCQVCFCIISTKKRYRCSYCRGVFHEWCRDNREPAGSGLWLCLKCKNLENWPIESFSLCQNELVSKEAESRPLTMLATSQNFDFNANSTHVKSEEINSGLNAAFVDSSNNIDVDRVANTVIRKLNNKLNNIGVKRICKTVPSNHFGPIPGVMVGTCWRYRYQAAESGVHRPLVAGIHGRENEGAYSIVLSGVYAEDQDFGDEFIYSGCGGRDPDKSKRLSMQTLDQKLTRHNKALAICCNAPFNDQVGAEAEDWQGGKPVRVIRNYKLKRNSIYAPEEGNRYDGIYKVVKYFPTLGQTGLLVWRYVLRRDDVEPAPWTEAGKKIIQENNLNVIWPDNSEYERAFSSFVKKEKIQEVAPIGQIKDIKTVKRHLLQKSPNYTGYRFPDMNTFRTQYSNLPTVPAAPVADFVAMSMSHSYEYSERFDIKPKLNELMGNYLDEPPIKKYCDFNMYGVSSFVSKTLTEPVPIQCRTTATSAPVLNITVTSVMTVSQNLSPTKAQHNVDCSQRSEIEHNVTDVLQSGINDDNRKLKANSESSNNDPQLRNNEPIEIEDECSDDEPTENDLQFIENEPIIEVVELDDPAETDTESLENEIIEIEDQCSDDELAENDSQLLDNESVIDIEQLDESIENDLRLCDSKTTEIERRCSDDEPAENEPQLLDNESIEIEVQCSDVPAKSSLQRLHSKSSDNDVGLQPIKNKNRGDRMPCSDDKNNENHVRSTDNNPRNDQPSPNDENKKKNVHLSNYDAKNDLRRSSNSSSCSSCSCNSSYSISSSCSSSSIGGRNSTNNNNNNSNSSNSNDKPHSSISNNRSVESSSNEKRISERVAKCLKKNTFSTTEVIIIKDEPAYEVPEKIRKFIELDTHNKSIWDYCFTHLPKGEEEFINIVRLMFTCRYCCKVVAYPVTTPCDHNVCLECITNHFSKKLFSCPDCHNFLGQSFRIKENNYLSNALEHLFPGYDFKLS